jgi:hypothetical protein
MPLISTRAYFRLTPEVLFYNEFFQLKCWTFTNELEKEIEAYERV